MGLLLDATAAPNEEEVPSLEAALSCLHILLRNHPHLRRLHAVAAADPAAEAAAAAAGDAAGIVLPYEQPEGEETEVEREKRWRQQELLLQHFVIPPLEKPLELPWDLAEALLLPAWRLQWGDRRQQLQLFSLRNAQVGDLLAAPLHALDLLYWKLTTSGIGGVAGCFLPRDKEEAELLRARRMASISAILRVFVCASKMLKWEETGRGPLADAGDEGLCAIWGGEGKTEGGGSPSGAPLSSGIDVEALMATVGKCAPLCVSPVACPSASLASQLVGEITLGATALLQHGALPGALECLDLGSSAAALQRRRVRSLARQQRQTTRRRLQKAAEGPQRAVLLCQRLTALALRNYLQVTTSQRGSRASASPHRQSPNCVEIVDCEQPSDRSCAYTPEAIDVDEGNSNSRFPERTHPWNAMHPENEADIGDLLEQYSTVGAFAFASVGTMLHGGEELRLTLLEQATEKHLKASGRARGSKGGRGRGPAMDPQAKIDSILTALECLAV